MAGLSADPIVGQSYQPAPISRESVISKAAEEIRRLIRARNLKPGDPLPVEVKLSQLLGISRSSVREALRILDGVGLVEKQPGRRVTVKDPSKLVVQPVVAESALLTALGVVYRVRTIVEERCAELAARNCTEEDIVEMEGHLAQFGEALKRDDGPTAAHAHAAFHSAVVTAARNPVLAGLFQQVRFSIAEVAARVPDSLRDPRQPRVHAAVLDAVRSRDVRRARGAIRRHFRILTPMIEFVTRAGGPDGP